MKETSEFGEDFDLLPNVNEMIMVVRNLVI